MHAIAILLYLANVACWLYVLLKIFQDRATIPGVVGLIFWPFAFVYGWAKSIDLGIRHVMLGWTLLLIAAVVVSILNLG